MGYGLRLLAVMVGKAWRTTAGLCHAFIFGYRQQLIYRDIIKRFKDLFILIPLHYFDEYL